MSSLLYTPPDRALEGQNILILNALDSEIESLCLYLQNSKANYNVHCYHSHMTQHRWAADLVLSVATVLIKDIYEVFLDRSIKENLAITTTTIIRYGSYSQVGDLETVFRNFIKPVDNMI